jgi:hypothetical protein
MSPRALNLFVVLAAWAFWLASGGTAMAAAAFPGSNSAADEPAPMCDPMGASVAAQPDLDLPLVNRGRFEQLPCEALALMLRSQLRETSHADHAVRGDPSDRPEQPAREVERTRHDGAGAWISTFPLRLEPVILEVGESAGLAPSRGHHRTVYRPPVGAA